MRFLKSLGGFLIPVALSMWNIGKWSEISVYKIPVNTSWLSTMLLQNMLSIRLAVFEFTRVGFVIHGKSEYEDINSANSWVGPWQSEFNRKIVVISKTSKTFILWSNLVYQLWYILIEYFDICVRRSIYYSDNYIFVLSYLFFVYFNENCFYVRIQIGEVCSHKILDRVLHKCRHSSTKRVDRNVWTPL